MKKLIGSVTSPYVRRIRLILFNTDYEFQRVDVFSKDGRDELKKYSPTGRVPLFIEGETVIWDSLLITGHLSKKPAPLETQKKLVLVNELNDAGIQLFQMRKFSIDPRDESVFSQNHLNRIADLLDYFEKDTPKEWDLTGQWLFCALDWMAFRSVYPWQDIHPNLVRFHTEQLSRPEVRATDPR